MRVAKTEHIYGYLWGWALPEAQQVESISVRGWTVEEFGAFVRSGDLVVGFASAWKRWQHLRWPENVTAVHAGDPIVDGVCEALLEHGLSRWIDVLGCTEHGALGVRHDRDKVYHLLPWWPDRLSGIHIEDELQWLDHRSFVHLGRKGYSTTKRVSTSTSSELA
ncbi:MAG: hypothetical protein NW208_00230 [Bryobacter sp.]|nr:hypothetical protein [Bryobacter sp.]